jgi:hypothetical protein
MSEDTLPIGDIFPKARELYRNDKKDKNDNRESTQSMVFAWKSNGSAAISVLQRYSTSRSTWMRMDMYKDIHEHFDCVEIKFCSIVQLAIAAGIWSGDAHFVKANVSPNQYSERPDLLDQFPMAGKCPEIRIIFPEKETIDSAHR